ncbi:MULTISPECIES: sensor histidine kinase [unclassified Kitasatospora]|uniref:sensor histidine kinase n=1 Tax=unclassified Kitasatospora TaxID=2633591 RepID=UPI0027DC961C|nr:sensor histidine kinase [Kitasatospora sp. RG8]
MERSPKPPVLLRRLSPDALTMLSWWAAAAFALVLYGTMPGPTHPVFMAPKQFLHLAPWALVLIIVALALPIGWASRLPVPVLGVLLAEAVAAEVFGERTWPFLLAADLLVFYVTVTRSRRTAAVAVSSVVVVWATVSVALRSASVLQSIGGPWASLVVTTVLAWIAGSWVRLRQEHTETLRAQSATRAVQAERARIARELHDMVAHSIGVIAIQAGAAARVIETQPVGARDALVVIETTSRETLAGLRRMLGALREADADQSDSAPAPGLADLDRLAETAADAGVRVEVRRRGRRRPLPPEVELSAFRIVQESVTNVVRHAGGARCWVDVDYGEEELSLEIVDDGRGRAGASPSVGSGYGIVGMRERVGLLHGQFSAGPGPRGGFRVMARLPL